jgi:hypothetical protein
MFEVAGYQIAPTHIGNCMGTRSKVLITAFRLYGIAIDLDVAPNIAVAHVPPLGLAIGPAKYSSYWLIPIQLIKYAAPLFGTLCDPCKGSRCRRLYLSFKHTLGLTPV